MRRRIRDFDRECARIRDVKPRKIDEAGIFPNAVAPRLTRRSRAPDGSGGASGTDRMGVWHYGPRPHLGRVPAQMMMLDRRLFLQLIGTAGPAVTSPRFVPVVAILQGGLARLHAAVSIPTRIIFCHNISSDYCWIYISIPH